MGKLNVQKIADFLKDSVKTLIDTDYTCCEYKLDDDLSLFVGWTEGYDVNDTSVYHDEDNPEFTIEAKIASNHEYMKTDLDWLTQPYYEDGEVWDTGVSLRPEDDFVKHAKWFVDSYPGIRKALDNGELLLENKRLVKEALTSNDVNKEIKYNFEEAYKDWGYDTVDNLYAFIDEYIDIAFYSMDSFIYDEVDWRKYIDVIPELKPYYEKYKDVEDWEIDDQDDIFELRRLVAEYTRNYLENEYKSEDVLDNMNEAKFKDKVKAIKKSLKKNDKRLSDKTAQQSAERIAGSMIKNESKDDRDYISMYDELNDLLDNFVSTDEEKLSLYNWFNDEEMTEMTDDNEEIYRDWLDDMIATNYRELRDYLDDLASNDEWYMNKITSNDYNEADDYDDEDLDENKKITEDNELKSEPVNNLINSLKSNLGITDKDLEEYYNEIKFKYNDKIYYAKPRSYYQADIYNEKHEQIGRGVLDDNIKEEVFTDYITNQDFIYELVGGNYAGIYTREEAEKLPIKEPKLTNDYSKYHSDDPDAIQPRKELQNQLQFNGYLGPMWNGIKDGKAVIRYETQDVYNMLSENKAVKTESKKIEGYNLKIFDSKPCPRCGSREYERVIDKEDTDGTQHFHYACPKCNYTEDAEEYSPSIDELNLKTFKQFFNNYINNLEIDDNILKKVNDCAKQELEDMGNSSSDIENAFKKWDKDKWLLMGLPNKESSYNDYASILERKYNLNKDVSLFLSYCIKCIREYYLPDEQDTRQEIGRKAIRRKTYDGDEYPATVIAEMIDVNDGSYHDYITQVDEIEYDDGSIEYHYRTSHSDGAITKQELDDYTKKYLKRKVTEDEEIIERPEDLIEDSEEDNTIHHNEDGSDKTILDYLEDRVGQEIEVGRLNTILQSIFGMYQHIFIMPEDLYNMDLDYTQTLTVNLDGEEYNIYYDIIDVDSGIVKIVEVEEI